VFLAYAFRRGQAFIARELYLPEERAQDGERRRKTAVPQEARMRTKSELAKGSGCGGAGGVGGS
jgi:SRSO17 transposase